MIDTSYDNCIAGVFADIAIRSITLISGYWFSSFVLLAAIKFSLTD